VAQTLRRRVHWTSKPRSGLAIPRSETHAA